MSSSDVKVKEWGHEFEEQNYYWRMLYAKVFMVMLALLFASYVFYLVAPEGHTNLLSTASSKFDEVANYFQFAQA